MFGFAELLEAFKDPHERFLRYLFSVFPLAAHQEAVLKNFSPIGSHKPVERIRIPGEQPAANTTSSVSLVSTAYHSSGRRGLLTTAE